MKRNLMSLLLAGALTISCMPWAGAAVSSDHAKTYLKALDEKPSANSYLVDFDGDGADELVLVWRSYPDDSSYQSFTGGYAIWQGGKKLVQVDDMTQQYWQGESEEVRYEIDIASCFIAEKDNRLYFVEDIGQMDCGNRIKTYTVRNGQWTLVDTMYKAMWAFAGMDSSSINGQDVDQATFQNAYDAYQSKQELTEYTNHTSFKPHSVKEQLANAVDTSVPGYEDVLSSLSASEKKALFEDLLYNVAAVKRYDGDGFNALTASDGDIVSLLGDLRMDTLFPIAGEPFTQQAFTTVTQQYFGRTIDYSEFAIDHEPIDYSSYYYNGMFYLCWPQRGSDVGLERLNGSAKHLYALGGNTYYTAFTLQTGQLGAPENDDFCVYTAIIKKNADNTWRLIRLYPMAYTPTAAELAAFVQPSGWAKAEVEAAQAASLVPALTGDPGWQDSATRLQFAQLAVSLAEKATGKTLPAAPAGTFTDCQEAAVLKAYAAGIVTGATETTFAPNGSLTREQLATMLWRTIDYIQKETGQQVLPSGGSLGGYTDGSGVSAYAKEAVAALAHHGLMKGTSTTTLSPKNPCTVEQSVLLIYRTFQKLA